MKILITGSNGQLGTELQKQIREQKSPLGPIPEALFGATVTAVDMDTLDVTDESAVNAFVKEGGYDAVLNCAAYTNVDLCENDPTTAYRVNADAAGYLADAAKSIGAKLVHVSTDYVFSGDASSPRRESDETIPKTVYGKSKLEGEQRVLARCPGAAVVRTAWLYGYNGNNFVKTILNAAEKNGAVKVVNDQHGNPTSAADLAHHLLLLAASDDGGVFHCTNHGICSWYDFAKRFLARAGSEARIEPCTTEEFPRPAPRPAYSALDNARLRETVGDFMRDWENAIDEYIDNLMKMK